MSNPLDDDSARSDGNRQAVHTVSDWVREALLCLGCMCVCLGCVCLGCRTAHDVPHRPSQRLRDALVHAPAESERRLSGAMATCRDRVASCARAPWPRVRPIS
eukprot:2264604-Prymnesium_polylepis.3